MDERIENTVAQIRLRRRRDIFTSTTYHHTVIAVNTINAIAVVEPLLRSLPLLLQYLSTSNTEHLHIPFQNLFVSLYVRFYAQGHQRMYQSYESPTNA